MDIREIVQKEIEKLERNVVDLIKNRARKIMEDVDAITRGLKSLENLKNVELVVTKDFDHVKHSVSKVYDALNDLGMRIREIFDEFESGKYRIIVAIMRIE